MAHDDGERRQRTKEEKRQEQLRQPLVSVLKYCSQVHKNLKFNLNLSGISETSS